MSILRVLLLNLEKGWRGGENQILLLARYLKSHGDEVTIAYPKNTVGLKKYQLEVNTLPLPSTLSWSPVSIRLLTHFVKSHDIQVIHANSSKSHALALRVKKRCPSLKLIVHRRVATRPNNNFLTRRQYLSPLVDSYVSLSHAISKELINYGISEDKIVRIPSGVVLDRASFDKPFYKAQLAKKLNLPSSDVFIGMACALSQEKGVDVFLRFAEALLKERKDVQVFIAGTGPQETLLREQAATLGISKNVHFLGFLNPVTEYLRALDVFFMPTRRTRTFREGLGSVLLEAIAARASIIASNLDGIPDVIIDKKTGHLVEPNDPLELLNAFKNLKPAEESVIQESALKHVEYDFTAEKMAERNRMNYLKLLKLKN